MPGSHAQDAQMVVDVTPVVAVAGLAATMIALGILLRALTRAKRAAPCSTMSLDRAERAQLAGACLLASADVAGASMVLSQWATRSSGEPTTGPDGAAWPSTLSGPSIERLGGLLERSQRLAIAQTHVADELKDLADPHWLVARNVWGGDRWLPFLVLGPTGVFVIHPTDGRWDMDDVVAADRVVGHLREQVPQLASAIHTAICLAFDDQAPRIWHGGPEARGATAWVVGLPWLHRWLYSFDPYAGPETGDLFALVAAAEPRWGRRWTATLPRQRNHG